ncbi:DNA cytosine methyltransferase [Thermophilibacter immobilis]|uniref:DNA cytosine methyltransferase n=1 Tax=Thermophilibacter immobilis TaxID=2779519 RepID=UPI0038CD828F
MSLGKVISFGNKLTALEFFSGIGLARTGLEQAGVNTIWTNDFDSTKCAMYQQQWGVPSSIMRTSIKLIP